MWNPSHLNKIGDTKIQINSLEMYNGLDSAEQDYGRVGKHSPRTPHFTSQHQTSSDV